MKAIVTVLKSDLDKTDNLFDKLYVLCEAVKETPEAFLFHPRPRANMDFICMLLNDDVPYKLTIENSITEAMKFTPRKNGNGKP